MTPRFLKTKGTVALTAAMLSTAAVSLAPVPAYAVPPGGYADLVEDVSPAVVFIEVEGKSQNAEMRLPRGMPEELRRRFEDMMPEQNGRSAPRQGLGSGFIISEDGMIVTNAHVVDGSDSVTVKLSDGRSFDAEVVGSDPMTDIAVLKVEADVDLPTVEFGSSDTLRVGDEVVAVGNPFGLGGTVTTGIVSALSRNINAGPFDDFIQTDAAINRGNSGGPLFNMDGQVIGINTAIISPSGGSIGLGFSIPSDLAINVIGQLREFGETRRGWLGVSIQPVTEDIAESLSMDEARGALVAGLTAKGPAKNSGILVGDVILEFDGKRIAQMRDLPRIVAETPVGKAVDVVVLRKGKEETVPVTLGRLEDSEKLANAGANSGNEEPEAERVITALGMTFDELNDESREKYSISADISGVVVTEVEPGSAAAEKGIVAGSVISEIGQEAVNKPEDVQTRLAALEKEGRKKALLLVAAKDGQLSFIVLKLD